MTAEQVHWFLSAGAVLEHSLRTALSDRMAVHTSRRLLEAMQETIVHRVVGSHSAAEPPSR